MVDEDLRVLCCGYARSTQHVRQGTTAYVVVQRIEDRIDDGRVLVVTTDRNGRTVDRWESVADLAAFRVATVAADHPAGRDRRLRRGEPEVAHAALLQRVKKGMLAA